MGPDDSVFAMIAMLVDRYPSDRQVQQFMTQLLNEFDTQIGLKVGFHGFPVTHELTVCRPRKGMSIS